MYRIMLADDEGIVIESLKFIIEKEFGSECELAYAKTGRSVIELAEQFRPDIAVMDIQMPGINGIEAMKEIRKRDSGVRFIIMSAYDKFDYAKEALRIGVVDYITKPMERSKIIQVIRNAMEKIDAERMKRSNELMIKEKLDTVVPIIESGFLFNILFQEYFTQDIDNYKAMLGIDGDYFYMLAVVYGDGQEGSHMTNAVGSSVKMQQHYQKVRESIKECFPGIIGAEMSNKIAVLVPCSSGEMDYNERIELIEKARELTRHMRKEIGISFRMGIGSVGQIRDMAKSYRNALRALSITTGSVAHVDDLPIHCDYAGGYPVELERKLFEEIENGNLAGAMETAKSFFEWMEDTSDNDEMDIKLKVLEFVLWAEKIVYEKGGMTYDFHSRRDYLPAIMAQDITGGGLLEWFLDKIENACVNVIKNQTEKATGIIETAKKYISHNFNKDISLTDVSREANISPYYFSKVFKDETGEGFVEYLTNIRLEKAKELLAKPELSMKEICSMTGYSDPNYFSRIFKKNVGVTPTEYKESCKR